MTPSVFAEEKRAHHWAQSAMKVSVVPITGVPAFLESWRTLYTQARDVSLFLSPQWMTAWLEGTPAAADIWAVIGTHGGKTVLLGVLGGGRSRTPPAIGMRSAHLHEFGSAAHDAIYVEYNDFLIAEPAPESARALAVTAVLDALGAHRDLVFRNIRPPLRKALEHAASERNVDVRILSDQPAFEIDLAAIKGQGVDVLSSLQGSLRSQIRRSMKRYEETGSLRLRCAETPDGRARVWKTLQELHEAAWRARGLAGAFANQALVGFHERLMRQSPEMVHLMEITRDEETIGCLYNLVSTGRAHNYQSGFRYEPNNQFKPGLVAHAMAAQYYLDQGYDAYDLLAGEAQYKRRLGSQAETLTTIVLEPKSGLRAMARNALRSLRAVSRRDAGTHQT